MRKGKLFNKVYFTTVVSVLLCMSIIVVLLFTLVGRMLAKEKRQLLSENCSTVSTMFTDSIDSGSFKSTLPSVVYVLSRAIDADMFLCDKSGNIFLCSCDEWHQKGSCGHSVGVIPESILSKANKEYYEVGNMSGRYNKAFYNYGMPLKDNDGNTVAYVFASSPSSALKTFMVDILKIYLICCIIPLVILFLVVYATTYRMTKPLNMMSDAAKSMAKGDFSKRVPVRGNDEVADLARSFNKMTDSLVRLESTRRSFVANVSHELKTPMTTIGGFIDGILDGTIPPERSSYYLNIVSSEVKRLSRLVRSMLCLSQLESGDMKVSLQKISLNEAIGATLIAQQQRIEEKNISIEGLDDGKIYEAFADADLISQVFYNLVDNAIKFTNDGGTISFAFSYENGYSLIKIRNTGDGIPEEELKYIFDRFYKVDKSRSANKNSTGLGLYIVKTIVDVHGGKITVRSRQYEYTEFEVALPYLENEENSAAISNYETEMTEND